MLTTCPVRTWLACLALLVGCNHHLYSPPARALPLEAPATLPAGGQAVRLSGGAHAEILDPTVAHGELTYRRAVAPGLELSGTGTIAWLDTSPRAGVTRAGGMGHLGLKLQLDDGGNISLRGGLGGGAHGAGGFAAADAGVVVGLQNRWVVPWLAVSLVGSQPIAPRTVETGERNTRESFPARPDTTGGVDVGAGLAIALGAWLRLHAGGGALYLDDGGRSDTVIYLQFGLEALLAPDAARKDPRRVLNDPP